ncbi:MAG: hypothetical protein JW951_06135 [Lentisphaerae bacterium]|nr:hypothetical protein [Lentisphaerota bacterium]
MRVNAWILAGLAAWLWIGGEAGAQSSKVSVRYLRAAAGGLRERATVSVEGVYLAEPGLVEARGTYVEGKGYSRFAVKDPVTGVVFDDMYCGQGTSAFDTLLDTLEPKLFEFSGYKDDADRDRPAIFVERVRLIGDPPGADPEEPRETGPATYRIIVTDAATSNRTVLVNVRPGRAYSLLGATLVLEKEAPAPRGVVVHGGGE